MLRTDLARSWRESTADPVYKQGQFIADLTYITMPGGQRGKGRTVANGHQKQEATCHFHHGLQYAAAFEGLGYAMGQTDQTSGDGGELVCPVRG